MPSPELFFETAFAHQRTAALKAAVDLDVFTAIQNGARTAKRIADLRGASERGIRRLCNYLTRAGFLAKTDDTYQLTAASAVSLSKHSRSYLRVTLQFLCTLELLKKFSLLAA